MNASLLALQSLPSQKNVGDLYLRLQLTEQNAAVLPMQNAQEVIVVPSGRIVSIPNMPPCVLGLLNQRSRIFWVVDLPQMLGLGTVDLAVQEYNIAIVRVGQVPLGLVVKKIEGITRFPKDDIQSPVGTVAPGLVPYLQGCFLQDKRVLLVLDAPAIVESPTLQQLDI